MTKHNNQISNCSCENCQERERLVVQLEEEWKNECDCENGQPKILGYRTNSNSCGNCGKWTKIETYCGTKKHFIERINSNHLYNTQECKQKEHNSSTNPSKCPKCQKNMNENELFFINDNTDKHGYSKGVCRLCIDELNQLENNPNKPKERERERDENSPPQPSPNNPKSFNWTPLLIAGLVLMAIGIIGYYFFNKKDGNKAVKK